MEHTWGKVHAWGKANARGHIWLGLIRACGAAATCVWSAYGLAPAILIVSASNGPTSHAWTTHGARGRRVVAGGLMV